MLVELGGSTRLELVEDLQRSLLRSQGMFTTLNGFARCLVPPELRRTAGFRPPPAWSQVPVPGQADSEPSHLIAFKDRGWCGVTRE